MTSKLFDKDTFQSFYDTLNQDSGLMETLCRMQTTQGIHERKAAENAENMIQMVSQRETVKSMIDRDARGALEELLHTSKKFNGYDRKVLLHQLYFGLKLYQDNDLGLKMKEGRSSNTLFREYYEAWGEDPSITDEILEEQILGLMDGFAISPNAMKVIARRLERSENLLATGAALGKEGLRFQCIAAMDVYLRNQKEMTMEESVNRVCTDVELQAVADAVSTGQITRDTAQKLLAAIALTLMVGAILLVVFKPLLVSFAANSVEGYTIANAAFKELTLSGPLMAKIKGGRILEEMAMWLFGGGVGFALLSDLSNWLGGITANHRLVKQAKESTAAEAMLDMAQAAEMTVQAEPVQPDVQEEELQETQLLNAF